MNDTKSKTFKDTRGKTFKDAIDLKSKTYKEIKEKPNLTEIQKSSTDDLPKKYKDF